MLPRVRAHVAGVKGFDVKACTGPSKRDDETIRSFETRVEQFKHARDRCKTAIEEKQSEASKKKRALLMDAATGVSTRTASKVARQAGIQLFLPEGKSKQQEATTAWAVVCSLHTVAHAIRVWHHTGAPPTVMTVRAAQDSWTFRGKLSAD